MLALNRSAIVVRPKLPFLEWLHSADPTSATLTLADLALEPTIYLVPECADGEQERDALRTVCLANIPTGVRITSQTNTSGRTKCSAYRRMLTTRLHDEATLPIATSRGERSHTAVGRRGTAGTHQGNRAQTP